MQLTRPPIRRTSDSAGRGALRSRRKAARVPISGVHVVGLPVIVCDVSEGGFGAIFQEPVETGRRFCVVMGDSVSDLTGTLVTEVAWVAGLRAGLRWVEVESWDQIELNSRIKDWLLSGGRWLYLKPERA